VSAPFLLYMSASLIELLSSIPRVIYVNCWARIAYAQRYPELIGIAG